ncbi:putative baseplate assembly protein [Myxococcota bacterium]|nr:putative baseplate assembly protein [Myxococcota bacterium]MBU1900024.1 putative baseplate assembly protein [Myxococcota bacterium]
MRLIPQYCPEWTNFNPSDPGVTLVELFAWMMEMAIYRLNKVTDKNYIAFLNMMGVTLQPPQPARTLLQFDLVPNGPTTLVKKGTPVSTPQTGKTQPIIFETAEDLQISGVQLQYCFTQLSDEYTDHTPALRGHLQGGFEVFGGANHIERSIYLGDPRFEQLNEDFILVVHIESGLSSIQLVDLLEWEYWNGRRWRELQKAQIEVEPGAVAFQNIDAIEEHEVNGLKSRWIRGRLMEAPPDPEVTVIDNITARVEVQGEGVELLSAYVNIDSAVFLTVDPQRGWAPFGKEPRVDNTFYLQPQSFPAQAGSNIRVEVQLVDSKHRDPPQPSEDLIIAWEYHNGKKWQLLGRATPEGSISTPDLDFFDGTFGFTQSGDVRFKRPADLSVTEVQKEEGHWLRARVISGDYGLPGQYELDGERWIWRDPRPLRAPWLKKLSFRYTDEETPIERVLTFNDFAYFDHSVTTRTPLKVFQAFEPSTEDSPTLYMGFDQAFPNSDVAIYFQMSEKTSLDEDRRMREYLADYYNERDQAAALEQRVVWEFWNGLQWVDLSPKDETRAFTESGFLKFIGPESHKRLQRFGQICYWLRARLEMGGYHQMPRIERVFLNSVFGYHHTTITNELLGVSDGTPNQVFRFAQSPLLEGQIISVLEREAPVGPERVELEQRFGSEAVREATGGGYWVRWSEVESFFDSNAKSRHYIVDRIRGQIRFGDGRKGMVPPAGARKIRADAYTVGGGAQGNITANALQVLRKSIAHVKSVHNPLPAGGGSDQETVEEAKLRGPHMIKSRSRAVTAEDYEWLTLQASNGIARAKCINTIGREGEVTVLVVPKLDHRQLDLSLKLVPSSELLRRVKHYLNERRLLTTIIHVQRPQYIEFSLRVEIIRKTAGRSEALRRVIEEQVRTFLHPLVGGRDGRGWPFGRDVLKLDLYHVIEPIDGIEMVHRIYLYDEDRKRTVEQVKVAPDELVYLVDVEIIERPREQFL